MEFCWKNKYFPTVWKNGITVLIYKKLDPAFANDLANFRPITLEPVIAKVFTSLIRNRIYGYISYLRIYGYITMACQYKPLLLVNNQRILTVELD